MKQRRTEIIVTALLTLLPTAAGIILWNRLPERIPTHWGADGTADGWSPRALAVFGMPLFLTAIHLLGVFVISRDRRAEGVPAKLMSMALWICPILGLVTALTVYPSALGYEPNVGFIASLIMGVLLIVTGNYMPKCRRNSTVGIRIPWTLASEDNWNRTHRFAGPVWMIGGAIVVIEALAGAQVIMSIPVIFIVAVVPIVYSFAISKK